GGFITCTERAADTEKMLKRVLCNLKTKTSSFFKDETPFVCK
ncbi:MAG: tRNA 2-thiouridine(34) synthase MnmA, partial [Bartonella sp.]|nr:tRNA 2-thiouridine(34) synthase MnmA [Bartonella sp.]